MGLGEGQLLDQSPLNIETGPTSPPKEKTNQNKKTQQQPLQKNQDLKVSYFAPTGVAKPQPRNQGKEWIESGRERPGLSSAELPAKQNLGQTLHLSQFPICKMLMKTLLFCSLSHLFRLKENQVRNYATECQNTVEVYKCPV